MSRIRSIDWARGATVLFIPAIHAVLLYSRPEVRETSLGAFLGFMAEWPGAQLLMLCMGIGAALSRKGFVHNLKRAVLLVLGGYLLNVLKFVLPAFVGVLPVKLLGAITTQCARALWELVGIGDILHFAGAATLLLAVVKRLPYYPIVAGLLAVVVVFEAHSFWDLDHAHPVVDYALGLVGGQPPQVFFPLLPWLVYPLVGLAIGKLLTKPYSTYSALLFSGGFLYASEAFLYTTPFHFPVTSFYRTYPDRTLMHLGFVVAWLAVWHGVEGLVEPLKPAFVKTTAGEAPEGRKGHKENRRFRGFNFWIVIDGCFLLLEWLSRHITVVYMVQWVVICWALPFVGYQELGMGDSVLAVVGVYCVTGLVSSMVVKMQEIMKELKEYKWR